MLMFEQAGWDVELKKVMEWNFSAKKKKKKNLSSSLPLVVEQKALGIQSP